jgi:MFS superfamily sulfate permease-like transporter
MLILQGLAYSIMATLPPICGLYTATLPPIIYAFFGTSKHLAVGPVALISIFYPRACEMLGLLVDTNDKEATAAQYVCVCVCVCVCV